MVAPSDSFSHFDDDAGGARHTAKMRTLRQEGSRELWAWAAIQFLPASVPRMKTRTDTVVRLPGVHSRDYPTAQNHPEQPAPPTHSFIAEERGPQLQERGSQLTPHLSPTLPLLVFAS